MEEHDPQVAVGDRREAAASARPRSVVSAYTCAQERLAEVGQRTAGEAADEALRADDADLVPLDLDTRRAAVEHADAGVLEHGGDLVGAVEVPVVVAEHREHRDASPRQASASTARLRRLAVGRQVAREQDEVGLALDRREGALDALARRLARRGCRRPRRPGSAAIVPVTDSAAAGNNHRALPETDVRRS